MNSKGKMRIGVMWALFSEMHGAIFIRFSDVDGECVIRVYHGASVESFGHPALDILETVLRSLQIHVKR